MGGVLSFNYFQLINRKMKLTPPLSKTAITEQLKRILTFPSFENSQVLSGFIEFIVTETLAGREQSLKEYTIGTQVLSKKSSYDPQLDASVRIHAGRLRRALDEYYRGKGLHDPIYISVPKGTYIPEFESAVPVKKTHEPLPLPIKPTLAVLPFHFQDENSMLALADGLCDQICTEFTNFNELSVVSYYSSRKIAARITNIKEAGLLLDAKYILTGSIQESGSKIRIRVQLTQMDTQHQVWGSSYENEKAAMNTFLIQDDIVRHVVNQIAGSHGIISREAAKISTGKQVQDIKLYDAVFWYYHMVTNQNEEAYEKALKSTQEAVQLDPQYALGWAILSEIYVAGFFNGFDSHITNPLDEAVRCGKEALKIDLRCQHAYQSLALAYLFQHKKTECVNIVEQWISLKSNAAGIAGGIGFSLICLGEYERGYKMLTDSIHLNPYYPWWFNGGISFYHFNKNEFEDSIYWADKMHLFSPRWELIMKAGSYVELGNLQEALACASLLSGVFPELTKVKKLYIGAFLQSDEIVNRLLAALEKVEL